MTDRQRPAADRPMKSPEFLLLVSLAAGDRHAYALRREVEERSDGRVRLGPASLYRFLEALLDDGMIEESDRRPARALDDARRRYYRVTERGRRALRDEAGRLEALAAAARAVLPARTRS